MIDLNTKLDRTLDDLQKRVSEIYVLKAPNSDRAVQEANDNNLAVVYPTSNEIQLDLDTETAYETYQTVLPIVSKHYGIVDIRENASRSGLPKRHVTVTVDKTLTNFERIALQACLGSDRIREILSVIQERNGDPHPTLFLEKKS